MGVVVFVIDSFEASMPGSCFKAASSVFMLYALRLFWGEMYVKEGSFRHGDAAIAL